MDGGCRNLYFSVMGRASSPRRASAQADAIQVPAFFLYGEPLQPPDERLVHVETIAARSQMHSWLIRAHRHRDLHQVLIIRKGRVEARLDGQNASLRAPLAIVVPPGAVHGFRFQPATVGVVISFAAALAGGLLSAGFHIPEFLGRSVSVELNRATLNRTDLIQLSEMLQREFGRSAPARRRALSGLLGALLANLQRLVPEAATSRSGVSSRDQELVARFRDHPEKSFRTHVPVGEYSALLKTSETKLLRACVAVTGESPLELVHLRLLIEAERQLRYTSMSVTEVAYYLGFEDPAYFSRFFTRRMGISPRAFRRRGAFTVLETASA